jgi:hypothetical protein
MDASSSSPNTSPRWGQVRRLAFIDLRLQYDGKINRTDSTTFFDVSSPQASADLRLYDAMAKGNMAYDASAKAYVALSGFTPQFGQASATSYLYELYHLASGVIAREDSFVGFIPPTGIVATPARKISSTEVATWVQAIRDKRAVAVEYQSMEQATPAALTLSAHAAGFDGLRWHIRAWCHKRHAFRDFAIGRLVVIDDDVTAPKIDPHQDVGWETKVNLLLVPHPSLTPSQREVVIRDYNMVDGELVFPCRQAMLFYTLRHLNLLSLIPEADPARQHVVVANPEQVREWLKQDRKD